ncbi:MAG: phage integrase N-terminal SAM-like domain-containing protein [Syntrophorhabdales bacterium]|jgi:site-specific recombinase XerD
MEKTLRRRMIEDMQFSPHTQKEYLMRVTLFAGHFKQLPDKLGEKELREYLLHLANEKRASYGVLNLTYYALKFIYTITLKQSWEVKRPPPPKTPKRLPIILDKEEVRKLIYVTVFRHRRQAPVRDRGNRLLEGERYLAPTLEKTKKGPKGGAGQFGRLGLAAFRPACDPGFHVPRG